MILAIILTLSVAGFAVAAWAFSGTWT